MALSLVKLSKLGSARYVAADPSIGEKSVQDVTEGLVASGKVFSIVKAVETADRALDEYQQYIPVLEQYEFDPDESELGQTLRFKQPESIFEMVSKVKGAVGNKKGQIVWDGAFGIAERYYGKETWKGKAPEERMVIPFLTGSNGKPLFKVEGWKKDEYQIGVVESKRLNNKKLVVADYGEALIALMLDLMDQGFPDAQVKWKWSRVFINNGEKNDRARFGSLYRFDYGVDDSSGDGAFHFAFVGASLES